MAVVKIVELIGSSPKSWEEATKNALTEAAKTIKNIKSVYVKRCNAKVENNKIVEYRAVVKIAFVVEREKQAGFHRLALFLASTFFATPSWLDYNLVQIQICSVLTKYCKKKENVRLGLCRGVINEIGLWHEKTWKNKKTWHVFWRSESTFSTCSFLFINNRSSENFVNFQRATIEN